MEVRLDPEIEARLSRAAAHQGRDAEMLAREAIERFLDCDEWFLAEVERGLAQSDRNQTLSHEEVGARMEKLLNRKQRRL